VIAKFNQFAKSYWNEQWKGTSLPSVVDVDPTLFRLANHVDLVKHRFLTEVISQMTPRPHRLLEIGCGGSRWLPYFALQFGLEVSGIDYSEPGCRLARQLLTRAAVAGDIICADLFSPPAQMLACFDLVASFGVVEHFEHTAECLISCARFLRPGGTMITMIPNLRGLPGAMQKRIDRKVFEGHVPLDCQQLIEAHHEAGLRDCAGCYLLFLNLCALNFQRVRSRFIRCFGLAACQAVSKLFWCLERARIPLPPNRCTSPIIVCVARKPLELSDSCGQNR
jgi:2-polyprenyl-3-methyl-5-hydroxy-6-metoxy-1,4-benzoquinol methylase